MTGVYKRGLNRFVIVKNYSFEHYGIREWGVNFKARVHDISKKDLAQGLKNKTIVKII